VFLFVILTTLHNNVNAQVVKFIKNKITTKYRVFVTKNKRQATHFIFRVSRPYDIKKTDEWYVISNPMLFKDATTLFEVKKIEQADLIVYYFSTRDSEMIISPN